ncbi:hypothetical protein GBAR_LOCUS29770 [Geodia barretti]|uniref:Uncharacterized protein n=1 Tax=Geodia barretti TaxID=519541 RepID=A0AA35TWZ1_GEOBA|nr:hypothetical protein GBAR_LOCUS29770 [Geodia barretti]
MQDVNLRFPRIRNLARLMRYCAQESARARPAGGIIKGAEHALQSQLELVGKEMISTAFSLTTVFLLAVTASVQDAAAIVPPDVFLKFVQGDASAFALMAEWSTTYKKWELLQRDVNTKYTETTDLTPCELTCQYDDAKKEMNCVDSNRQTSIELQQTALTAGNFSCHIILNNFTRIAELATAMAT